MVPGQIAYCHDMLKRDRQHLEARVGQLGCQEPAEVRGQIQLANARFDRNFPDAGHADPGFVVGIFKPAPDPIRQKVDPGQIWDMLVAGDYDVVVAYWTNDIIDPDQKSTFSLGMDDNLNYWSRYKNQHVADLVAQGRVELDPDKRREIYYEVQRIVKDDVHWIDLYYAPYRNISRSNVHDFFQNPLGRFMLETTTIAQ
jgi:hypothetical protein